MGLTEHWSESMLGVLRKTGGVARPAGPPRWLASPSVL